MTLASSTNMAEVDRCLDACMHNKISVVRSILTRRPGIVNMENRYGTAVLSCAMSSNSVEVMELLLARDEIDIAMTDSDNWTPLHWGCYNNSVDTHSVPVI